MKLLAGLLLVVNIALAQPTLTTIYNLGDVDPGGVVVGPGRVLYGSDSVQGMVYSLTPPASPGGSWTLSTLYSYLPAPRGLAVGKDGVVYGTTEEGGPCGCGTIFALHPPAVSGGTWTHEILYNFTNGADGDHPLAVFVISDRGVLYGVTPYFDGPNAGTVYSVTPPATPDGSWVFQTLHDFTGGDDGGAPDALTIGPGGVLFGTTNGGGLLGHGTVYSLTPPTSPDAAWTFKTIYSLAGGSSSGLRPNGLAVGKGGVIYGSMATGGDLSVYCSGADGCGTLYSLAPPRASGSPWVFETLYTFTRSDDGGYPLGVLIGPHGKLFGATSQGGSGGVGTVFSLTPPATPTGSWSEATLVGLSYASGPKAPIVFGLGGALYGTTALGNTVVFAVTP